MAENITNLIVGLGFRGLCGPVDQPGIQRVRAGRRSPAWQVVLDPECGKALALLRRAAGSNPARSTRFRAWREVREGPQGPRKIRCCWSSGDSFSKERFQEMVFQMGVFRNLFLETVFSGSDSKKAVSKTRFQESDLDGLFPDPFG